MGFIETFFDCLRKWKIGIETFFDCIFKWGIEPKGEIKDADVIIAQSFGFRFDGTKLSPGLSNEEIARRVWGAALEYKLPMILQWEVADALPTRLKESVLEVVRKHRTEGEYLDTEEVLFQTKKIMDENNWKKAVIYAHPLHIWRVKKQAEKVGIEVIIPQWLDSIPFDPKSEQWWTRNKFVWKLREAPARVFLLLKGKI